MQYEYKVLSERQIMKLHASKKIKKSRMMSILPVVETILNDYASENWEVVAIRHDTGLLGTISIGYVLKRPKANEATI
jgi:hypothetical protein